MSFSPLNIICLALPKSVAEMDSSKTTSVSVKPVSGS